MSNILGFDIGSHAVHIALRSGNAVKKIFTETVPEGSVRDGRIVSYAALGEFIRQTCKKHKMRADYAAVILPEKLCVCRRLSVPVMTHEQLMLNLPYEFRDFIASENGAYFYDYAVLRVINSDNGEPVGLDIMAAATLKSTAADFAEMFRRAGIKLKTAIPVEMAYTNLMLRRGSATRHCHCIVDVGHTFVRLYIFRDGRLEGSHLIEGGCSSLDGAIADALHIDPFIAMSYREADHNECQSLSACMSIYCSLAAEIQRVLYYFRYKNPDVGIDHIHVIGGGAKIGPLVKALEETLSVSVADASELLNADGIDAGIGLGAAGAALQ